MGYFFDDTDRFTFFSYSFDFDFLSTLDVVEPTFPHFLISLLHSFFHCQLRPKSEVQISGCTSLSDLELYHYSNPPSSQIWKSLELLVVMSRKLRSELRM